MKMNHQIGTTIFLASIATTLIVAVVIAADAPIVGQNNRVMTTYTNSTTTFTNILGLSLMLLPSTTYQFTMSVIYQGIGAQFAVAPLPLGTTFTACGNQAVAVGSGYSAGCKSSTGIRITVNPTNANSGYGDMPAIFTGSVSTGAIGGTFQMQGAVFSAGNTLTVEVNSWIQAQVSSV